jgi:hypothetical protein
MTLRGRTNSLFVSSSATEALFRQPVPPELDPAQLLDELRTLRPVIDRLARLEPVIRELETITVAQIQAFARAVADHNSLMLRLEHVGPQIQRVEELIQILDELDVIVRRG